MPPEDEQTKSPNTSDLFHQLVSRTLDREDLSVEDQLALVSAIGNRLNQSTAPEVEIEQIKAKSKKSEWLRNGLLTSIVAAIASIATGYYSGFFGYKQTVEGALRDIEIVKETQRGELVRKQTDNLHSLELTDLQQRATILERLLVINLDELGAGSEENYRERATQERKARICLLANFGIISVSEQVLGIERTNLLEYSQASNNLLENRYGCSQAELPQRLPVTSSSSTLTRDEANISKQQISSSIEEGKKILDQLEDAGIVPYDEKYLSHHIPFQITDAAEILDYYRFSVAMHSSRPYAAAAAWNVDGTSLKSLKRTGSWGYDPRIPLTGQAGNELYYRNEIDRGHLVRRLDVAWGTEDSAKLASLAANSLYTNVTPQHQDFNQNTWVSLEDDILNTIIDGKFKASIFAGPVVSQTDPIYRGVPIPVAYWKIVILENEDGEFTIGAFIASQEPSLNEFFAADFGYTQLRGTDTEDLIQAVTPDRLMAISGITISLPDEYQALNLEY